MADDITNGMILEQMQEMKKDVRGIKTQVGDIKQQISNLEKKMDEGFEDANKHRQALQEDLEETMRVQSRHGTKLARL